MNLDQFRYMETIEKMRSINAAADRLYMSHQALSRSIANLEEELGCALLNRTARGVTLTDEGTYFLQVAHEINTKMNDLHAHYGSLHQVLHESIRVDFNSQEYTFYSANIFSYYRKNFPDLDITYCINSSGRIIERLLNDEIDIGIVTYSKVQSKSTFNPPETKSKIEFTEISREPYLIACHKNSPLNHGGKASIKELAFYPAIILSTGGDRERPDSPALLLTESRGEAIVATTDAMFLRFLKDNFGWAVTLKSYLKEEISPEVVTIPLKEDAFAIRGYLSHKDAKNHELIQDFMGLYKQHMN